MMIMLILIIISVIIYIYIYIEKNNTDKLMIIIKIIIRRPGRAHGCEGQWYRPLSIHLPRLQMQIQTSELSPSKAPDANAPFFNC